MKFKLSQHGRRKGTFNFVSSLQNVHNQDGVSDHDSLKGRGWMQYL